MTPMLPFLPPPPEVSALLTRLSKDQEAWQRWQNRCLADLSQLWERFLKNDRTPVDPSLERDRRFNDPAWRESPIHDFLRQSYVLLTRALTEAVESLFYPDGKTKCRALFFLRQWLDAAAPSNFAATNPEFLAAALASHGQSIEKGLANLLADLALGRIRQTEESAFRVGENLATTPGAVIFRNPLMELIQYTPLTSTVAHRPLLIVPPCINKYYIMDLQPDSSFIRFAVEQGHTVFLISWKNPKSAEAHFGWDDYLQLGPLTALEIVRNITGVPDPNVVGFCIGGTILASALAVAAARGDPPVASLTLMTTLLDFTESGELGCLVDEALVATREAAIGRGGLLLGAELHQTFSLLRANDLIWQYVVHHYLKGESPKPFDLLFWNSDSTNLPGPFLVYYLRHMYLENELRLPERLTMLGQKINLARITAPAYILAAREDHIVPWRGAYYSRSLLGGECRFVLTASGHIAGAINPAQKNRRSYWTNPHLPDEPDRWLAAATEHPGSWWWDWISWLNSYRGEECPARDPLSNPAYPPLEPAPGRYVREPAWPLT